MRAIRYLVWVPLLAAGCVATIDSQDDHHGQAGTAGTTGTGNSQATAATGGSAGGGTGSDDAAGGAGGSGVGSATSGTGSATGGGGPGGGAAGMAGAAGSRADAALPADAPATGSTDASRDAVSNGMDAGRVDASDGARAPDAGGMTDSSVGGDPEPGLLAGITRFHNDVRAQVSVPGLTWDPTIGATAQAYAARCIFQHSGTAGLGENLAAYAPSGGHTASSPVNDWASEKANYDYASNSCSAGQVCGHYTQIVWKNSLLLGCGVQACNTNSPFAGFPNWEIWVCNYSPPGNFVGQKPY